ncbi:MAG: hypothetical protein ACI9P9_000301 [Patescibacteria group bacterium]|jgi:hypothetical protein
MDSELDGRLGKHLNLYCLIGTALTLSKKKNISYDMDFIISRDDHIPLSEISAELECSQGLE